ncbi:Phytochrome-like protein cph2 [compost metagenome]
MAHWARSILDGASRPFRLEHLLLRLGARLGISHSGMPHQSPEHLVRLAALAVPEDNGAWRLYQAGLEAELQRRTRYRQALEEALEREQMFLVYQPKVELHSGRVIGAEALLRWVHPELGFVPPAEFIPLAEASGEILRLGDWVLDNAIRQLEVWFAAAALPADFRVAVNVAPLQLMQADFADALIARLHRSALPAGAIEVEVTESGLMQDVNLARSQLQRLAQQGLSVAIDDFGTGYSSLAYLKTLPVSVLKIDRTFVSSMDTNLQDQHLAETVIDMAGHFGCSTVAEGVEKEEQAQMLRDMGCQLAQGYWYSPPLKVEQFVEYCAARQPEMA